MTRRHRILLATAIGLALVAASLHWASRPQRLTAALLDRIGASLGLEITAAGVSEYRLRGAPRIVVRDLVARQPGAGHPLLRAGRVELVLPWSTLRARGSERTATRVEIDDATLDLPALRRWQATQPATAATRIPTLTDGLRVRRSQVLGQGWAIRDIAIALPRLQPGRALRADVQARMEVGTTRIPLDLAVRLSEPAADAMLDARGDVAIRAADWQLPMRLHATGRLRLDADVPRIESLRTGADARYLGGTESIAFVAGLAGDLRFPDGDAVLAPAGVAIRGEGAIPTLDAGGRIGWQDSLALHLDGVLARWPEAWPALPAPLGRPRSAVPFELAYRGAPDLSGATSLKANHDATFVDVDFRLPAVLAWIDSPDARSPLPPLSGRMRTPRLQIPGATLEGVQIGIEDEDAAAARDIESGSRAEAIDGGSEDGE